MHDIIFSWIKISETFSSITFSFELVDATFDGSKENPTSFFFLIFIYLFFNEKYGWVEKKIIVNCLLYCCLLRFFVCIMYDQSFLFF